MKKRNKVSAEFSMSSLTDIIFLLLIFFMLTSSMVQINMPLPQSSSTVVAPTDLSVTIMKNGKITVNGKPSSSATVEKDIANAVRFSDNKKNATLNIIAESGVTWDKIHPLIKLASGLKIKAIIATQAPSGKEK
ncbi:MAG TPA: biopolymer transporter ExbD [Saprospiraceae bacterium]|nr:biopolymer transporter ExbD [Saprospiraceae bacterium]